MDILIISCTRGSKEDTMLYNTRLVDKRVHYRWFEYNTDGISKCYNTAINEEIQRGSGRILLFVHDDVEIDTQLVDKLNRYLNEYDIIGVAGTKHLNLKQPKIAWHLHGSDKLYGSVMHKNENDQFWMTDFSKGKYLPQRVLSIDGVFIAMNNDAYKTLEFDSELKWDFYDMALCVDAYKNDISIGVVPIQIIHESIGSGVNSGRYIESQNIFMKNHCIDFN